MVLVSVFIIFILNIILRDTYIRKEIFILISMIIDIILIFIFEQNSRFAVNYFIHTMYIITIIESSLKSKIAIAGYLSILFATYKYVILIQYKPNYENISQMVFSILINIIVIFAINSIKKIRNEKQTIDSLYKELLQSHKALKDYSEKLAQLALISERTKIARDLHDTLGHMLTGLIMNLEVSSHLIMNEPEKSLTHIENAKNTAREGLKTVREVIQTLRTDEKVMDYALNSILELINNFKNTSGVNVTLDIKGETEKLTPEINNILFRIVQESLTNAVRHGKAEKIYVTIEMADKLFFEIYDNGIGCSKISMGYGLKGMTERINQINGTISFKGEAGFSVRGTIPLCFSRMGV